MKFHLGIIDHPYSLPSTKRRGKRSRAGTSTAQVAVILENRYHIIETFWNTNEPQLIGFLETSMKASLEAVMMGKPATIGAQPFASGMSRITERFKSWISDAAGGYPTEAEQVISGAPTLAALAGVNTRLRKKRGPRRPSFVDTGLYQSSFTMWAD